MSDNNSFSLYSESLKKIADMTSALMEQMKIGMEPLSASLTEFSEQIRKYSEPLRDISKVITSALKPLSEAIENASNNPNSLLSWYDYYKTLSKLFWIFPYGISVEELKKITKKDINETQFDTYMIEHFTVDLLKNLKQDTLSLLPEKHRLIYSQAFDSMTRESYALCNLGLISIIDDLTSFYLKDKGCSTRNGLMQPIVDLIKTSSFENISAKHILLMMINENINMLYVTHNFNREIRIDMDKDINRHTSMHGKYYSNNKASSLMLLNTIYYLTITNIEFSSFEGSIIFDKNDNNKREARLKKNKKYSLYI